MKEKIKTEQKAITMIALTIMILVFGMLITIGITSGISILETSQLAAFTAEMEMMQMKVNELYEGYKNNEQIDGIEILELGKDINSSAEISERANDIFSQKKAGITDQTGYKYYDLELIEKVLNMQGITLTFYINIEKRSIVCYEGFEFEGETYYTLKQLPNGVYNVEYKE